MKRGPSPTRRSPPSRRPRTRSMTKMSKESYMPPTSPSLSRLEFAKYSRAAKEKMGEMKHKPDLGKMSRSALVFSSLNFAKDGRYGHVDAIPILNKLESRDYNAKQALVNFFNEHEINGLNDDGVVIQINIDGKTDYRNLRPSDLGDLVDYGCVREYDDEGYFSILECYFEFSNAQIQLSVPRNRRNKVNITKMLDICELFKEIDYLKR